MKNSWKEIGIVAIVVFVALGGLYLYLRRSQQVYKPQQETTEEAPQKGDVGYNEEKTTVEVGSKDVMRGTFNRIENGKLYLAQESGLNIEVPLTEDDVVLACSSEDLSVISELDFNYFKKVLVYTPAEIGSHIPDGETIIVFTGDVNGEIRAHTIAIDATKCPVD
jgi:hypothetical protein